ncbi:hypothetical protein KCU63_g23816, partial [Aureobasidium melanogenum]
MNMSQGITSVPQMQQQYQQKLYQQRLQQQQQRLQANSMAQVRANAAQTAAGFNPAAAAANASVGSANGMATPGQSSSQSNQQKQEQWMRSLQQFCQQNNRPFNPQPQVCGRPLPLYIIWVIVLQHGGSTRVTQFNGWNTIAQKVGFNIQQYPTAAQELQQLFETNLGQYERVFMQARMQQRQQAASLQARQLAGLGAPNPAQGSPGRPNDQLSAQQQTMMQMQQKAQQQQQQQMQQAVQQQQQQA